MSKDEQALHLGHALLELREKEQEKRCPAAARWFEGIERVRNFWQPIDFIRAFHGVASYHLLRRLLQVSDFSEENEVG